MNALSAHLVKTAVAIVTALALVGATADLAAAASPPTAVTGPASAVAVTMATVSGNVNPNGTATSWYFEYGPTTTYGSHTTSEAAGSTPGTIAVSLRLTGLVPGTTYHFRVVAASGAGTVAGADGTFHTPALPPTVVKEAVAAVHDTSVQVSAAVIPNGLSTTWYARYGTSPALGGYSAKYSAGSGIAEQPVSITLTRLARDTTYYFDIVATNAVGSAIGHVEAFSTTGPPVITAQSFTALAPTSAELTAAVNAEGHPTTWYFQYGTTTSYGATTPIEQAGSATAPKAFAKSIAGLVPNTVYHFRLIARNGSGAVAGADASFTTPGPTITSPTTSLHFGHSTTLSGTVPSTAANEAVTIYEQPVPTGSFVLLATVLTAAGGSWTYPVHPQVVTTYKVMWKNEVSPQLTLEVMPAFTLSQRSPGVFASHVAGSHTFAHRLLRLQRLEHGSWRTITSARLDRSSVAVLRPHLPKGLSRLRVYFTTWQAGTGYVGGYSVSHVYREQ